MSEPSPEGGKPPQGRGLMALWGALVLFALAVMLLNR